MTNATKLPSPTPSSPSAAMRATIDATEMSAAQRWKLALAALGKVLADPERTDQVLVFSVYANAGTMRDRIPIFLDDADGRRLFEEHRTIDTRSVDLDALATLPAGTLGRAYADFLRRHQLSPDVFEAPPEQISDPAIAYVIQRVRQTHDLWHVVTGFETDPGSEIALQAFTFGQLRAPSSLVLALAGSLRASRIRPSFVVEVARAMRAGRRARPLAAFPWEDHWQKPLAEVRARLGISPDFVASTTRARLANYPNRAQKPKNVNAAPTPTLRPTTSAPPSSPSP
jgi:ubiquinone biosynthesis protein COQ4